MIYNGASGREGLGMPSVMNQSYLQTKGEPTYVRATAKAIILAMFILTTLQVLINYLRLILLSVPFLRPRRLENLTFREWTAHTVPNGTLARISGLDIAWKDFTRQILIPLFSAVCTASETDVMEHPMEEFLGKRISAVLFVCEIY
jgi:microfibrillar-associated protein 1